MGKQTLLKRIKGFIAGKAFRVFLWGNNLTQEQYWRQVYKEEKAFLASSGQGEKEI